MLKDCALSGLLYIIQQLRVHFWRYFGCNNGNNDNMMLTQKLFRQISRIALFAIVFASFAPSISHALAAKQGLNSFAQEICTTDGQNITIQVVTAQGQQLVAELEKTISPSTVISHFNHCLFCSNPSVNATLLPPHAFIVAVLKDQVEQFEVSVVTTVPSFTGLPPPAQAPPQL